MAGRTDHIQRQGIGLISLTRAEAAAFSLDDMMWVQAFTMQAGIALDNARLYAEVAYFKEQLEERVRQRIEELNKMSKSEVYLFRVIERVRRDLETALEERRLTLTISDLETLPHINADPELMFKVFDQLITNAIKYIPDCGRIHVAGRVVKAENGSTPSVEVVISGTDIGITSHHHELILGKFYQPDEAALHSSGRIKGAEPGSSLATVWAIVLAHGGRIWVESERYDEKRCPSSRFHVQLPIHPELNPETLLRLSEFERNKSKGGYRGGL